MFEAMWSKNVRSDFFQILNTYSFHSNEQNTCSKFSEKIELWENILAYLFCIAGQQI